MKSETNVGLSQNKEFSVGFQVKLNVEVMNQVTDLPSVECSKTKTNLIIYQLDYSANLKPK